MKQLLEAGVHFGHQTRRWNPKMARFIFTERNGIHIIDLQKSVPLIEEAYRFVRQTVATGGEVLFVGTKKQAQDAIREESARAGQPYVNQRWLRGGGPHLPTNPRLPAAVYVVDTRKEHIAVAEARKLSIPVVAIVDTNSDPDEVDYPIPGNDDAIRAVRLITNRIANASLEGLEERRKLEVTAEESEAVPVPLGEEEGAPESLEEAIGEVLPVAVEVEEEAGARRPRLLPPRSWNCEPARAPA